jgi:hypothetical protein
MPTPKSRASIPPKPPTPKPPPRRRAKSAAAAKPPQTAAARTALARLNVRENRRALRLMRQAETIARKTDRAYDRAQAAAASLVHGIARRLGSVVIPVEVLREERAEAVAKGNEIRALNRRIAELETELGNAIATVERAIGDGAELARHIEHVAEGFGQEPAAPEITVEAAPAAAGKD